MIRVFVTGVTGFAGSHLVDSLLEQGNLVYGLVHPESGHLPFPDHQRFKAIEGDLADPSSVRQALIESNPEIIYHLGGIASPSASWRIPGQTVTVNTGGTANILKGAQETNKAKVIVVTSGLLYSSLEGGGTPIDEETPPKPTHPYAVSKLAASLLTRLFWLRYELPVIEARPLNHIGPRQARGFVVPDFASQLAEIESGLVDPVIRVGNLSAERDFTDVRDIVRGYQLLAKTGEPGETYLICSGVPTSIQFILDTLLSFAGVQVKVEVDPDLYRPLETPVIYGNRDKITSATGWKPEVPLERSLHDAYWEWRERISHESS